MAKIALSDMIVNLREQLADAQAKAAGTDLRFRVAEIEVELEVVASSEGGAGTKIDFWVYTAELEGKLAHATTQKLKLKLEPITGSGDLEVSRRTTR